MNNPTQLFDNVTTFFSTSVDLTYSDIFFMSFFGCLCANFVDNLINTLNEYIKKKKTNKQQESKECDPYGL